MGVQIAFITLFLWQYFAAIEKQMDDKNVYRVNFELLRSVQVLFIFNHESGENRLFMYQK